MFKKILLFITFVNSLLYADISIPHKSTEVFGEGLNERKIIHMMVLEKPTNVEFQMNYNEIYKGLKAYTFEVYDANGQKGHQFLRIFPDTKSSTKVNLPLKTGLYKIMMFSSNYLEKPFEFSVNSVQGHYEQEPNDTFLDSTLIKENTFYTGYIQRKDGNKLYDYYKLTIENDSKLQISFKANERCNDKSGYEGYKIAVYDGDMSKGKYKVNYPIFDLKNTKKETIKTLDAVAGDYYIRVKLKDSKSFNKCDWNRSYSIKYKTTPL